MTKHPTRRWDDAQGQAFAKEVIHALARWEVTRDKVASGAIMHAAFQHWLADRISMHLPDDRKARVKARYQYVQVGRVLRAEQRTFDKATIEAWCAAIPTLDRIKAYAALEKLPPELRNAEDLAAVVSLLTRRNRGGDGTTSDQGERGTARYSVHAGDGTYAERDPVAV